MNLVRLLIDTKLVKLNKLFYHFEQNPNASVTTTTGQMYVVYKDLQEATQEIKQILGE